MVLILYIESGSGSLTLARNIQLALTQDGIESRLLSLHDILPEWLNEALFGNYQRWCNDNKTWFEWIFRSRWFYPGLYTFLPLIIRLKNKGKRLEAPSAFSRAEAVVACSFFCGWFSNYLQKNSSHPRPVYGVLGDYTVSPGWDLPLERLFIPMAFESPVFRAIRRKGGKITASGIPASLNQVHDAGEKGCVMFSGGGWGLHLSSTSIESLLGLPSVTTLIVLCGSNRALCEELNARFRDPISAGRLEVHPYTSEVQSLYARAEVVIAKAGGLTLTEAALCGKPLVISGYLPGHEEENLRVFLRHDAALYAENDSELVNAVQTLLSNPDRALTLKKHAAALVNQRAGAIVSLQIKKDIKHVDA
ncbi:glycosyltransferase [Enterobacter sp. KBR-315C3_2022]|uniref:glycosyltransferase n=1 Tax=Enterobacter sp. KBR-315C3_2022 TaxID=3242494 RepID=UPI0035283AFA